MRLEQSADALSISLMNRALEFFHSPNLSHQSGPNRRGYTGCLELQVQPCKSNGYLAGVNVALTRVC
jgi:hypothetical protein